MHSRPATSIARSSSLGDYLIKANRPSAFCWWRSCRRFATSFSPKDLMQRHRLARPAAPFSFISALNRLPESATEHLPRKKDGTINGFALGIAAQNAHRFEVPQLIAGLEACLQANLQLVSSQLDHELILTEIVVKLLGRTNLKRRSSTLVARSPRRSAFARSGRCREYPNERS